MKIGKRDWIFVAVIVLVLITFYLISGEERTKRVPYDDKHITFY